MRDCVKKLLNADDEDSLELLCNLLTTIGKELDTEKLRVLILHIFKMSVVLDVCHRLIVVP